MIEVFEPPLRVEWVIFGLCTLCDRKGTLKRYSPGEWQRNVALGAYGHESQCGDGVAHGGGVKDLRRSHR